RVPHDPPLAPRCYGGDLDAQTIVLEDLGDGDGPNTYDLLLGDDPRKAEASLLEHVRLLGRLDAATLGRCAEHAQIREALGPPAPRKPLYQDPWSCARGQALPEDERARAIQDYERTFRLLGLAVPAAVAEEIERVSERVEADPGPFAAFCQGDVNAPGN